MNQGWQRNSLAYLLVLLGILVLVSVIVPWQKGPDDVGVFALLEKARQGEVDTIQQKGNDLIGLKGDRELLKAAFIGTTAELLELLRAEDIPAGGSGVKIEVKTGGIEWAGVLFNFVPLLLFGGLLFFLFRSARGANTQAFNFGRSRAKVASNMPTITFADVAGIDEAKQEVSEIVDFLKAPQRFQALGARIPRGVLLVGPPGTGKTLLAKAIAGEASVPFFSISGSEFVEMFVGVGAARARDLFEQAKRSAPCIVFVDEIDAVGRHRGAGLGGGHDEREQTLNQILVEMDGFSPNTNVIVLAATNRPDILDPALLRPGRFDRHIVLDLPDIKGRKQILEVHAKGKVLAVDVNLEVVARETVGFSGADLANLINEAAILAARRNRQDISMMEMEEASDRVVAGPEKRSRVISKKEKEIIAYHESGHALVARNLPNADPVHKVTVVARGMMGGWTRFLPVEDRHLWTRSWFEAYLAVTLAGRAAEEVAFGEVSTGAQNDLQQATVQARKMVTQFGMSELLGPRTFGRHEELVFLGKEISEQRNYSERTALEIDREIRSLVEKAHTTAREIIIPNRDKLDRLVKQLIERETVDGPELDSIFGEVVPAPAS
ncbi:MAG: ATP-dependent zinc metalloprotease FtsH [Chloroflexota bacterium]